MGNVAMAENAAANGVLADIARLTKPRLTLAVLFATLAGYYLACPGHELNPLRMFALVFGTLLVAAGSGMLNQVLEESTDRMMRRTADRPVPTGRMAPGDVLIGGVILSIAGMIYLARNISVETAALAGLTNGIYVFAYTPLKRRTTANTLVGAIPGALPPLIGWTAADARLDLRAGMLFAILFVWQIPHFFAIAWRFRDDYARAGLRMLPVVNPESAARQSVFYSLFLIPLALAPWLLGMSGWLYATSSVALGAAFAGSSIWFYLDRRDLPARWMFWTSIVYLPTLLAMMMFDA